MRDPVLIGRMIRIHRRVLSRMIAHARRAYPVECCGLLSGREGLIERSHEASNEKASPREFQIPVRELFDFFLHFRSAGREHLGIYHSHPRTPPVPSRRDVLGFHYPGVSYWIVSLEGEEPRVGCYRWCGNGFRKTPFDEADHAGRGWATNPQVVE